jgi:hypothetical protein
VSRTDVLLLARLGSYCQTVNTLIIRSSADHREITLVQHRLSPSALDALTTCVRIDEQRDHPQGKLCPHRSELWLAFLRDLY